MVASQLLQNPSNTSTDTNTLTDTRIPPKLKNQLVHKNKVQVRHDEVQVIHDEVQDKIESSHAGIAVPVTMEELEKENKVVDTSNESSTTNEGISTWILLSNPTNKDNKNSSPTEPTKPEETTKKAKPAVSKNKPKRPTNNKNTPQKRPIIGSTNKSDLIAGGSAINENVFNKIKDTVLSNVQKNKNASQTRITTSTTTTLAPTSTSLSTKSETMAKKPTTILPIVKVTSKPKKSLKKKKKNKPKTTTISPTLSDSALLPMEAKEQEIELEVSTPATTTKKPKRSSTKSKKKKNKKKTSKPQVDTDVSETKTSNKTKSAKPSKKPNPITTQIYNYLSREVMPSVGVGIVGLAGLVGLAGYFLYPFATPVRRTFEVDKKDDIYRHNAEEYAGEGNGQAEEEMLGTVLAGMPAHSKKKLNPYLAQTTHRYPQNKEKEQNLKYRHVASNFESPNYNDQYHQNYQQKTGLAHGAVYSEPLNFNSQYDTRHSYPADNKYQYESKNAYTYPAVEPIYAAPQTGPSAMTSYGNEAPNAIVYGVKPTQDTEFKPVYPYEGQIYSETTSQPAMTYPPTSMYLGSSEDAEQQEEPIDESNDSEVDNKFVVGNVPKELVDSVTPAIVPEHGPRKLNRKRRSAVLNKRSIVSSIEDIIKAARKANKDVFLSNEIDEISGILPQNDNGTPSEISSKVENQTTASVMEVSYTAETTTIFPVYAVSQDSINKESDVPSTESAIKGNIVESISTLPLHTESSKPTTEPDMSNELDATTKPFKVYEVFSNTQPNQTKDELKEEGKVDVVETTTEFKNMATETTTDSKSDTTTTAPSTTIISQTKGPTEPTYTSTKYPKPTFDPNVITYPPSTGDGGFLTFIKRLIEFKYRLGISILQATSDSLNKYLQSMDGAVKKMANASQKKE